MDARTNGQRMRCLLTLAVGCVVLAMTLVGCRATPVSTPAPALEMSCDNPVATSLGAPTARRPARLTTSGGRLRFVVRDLPPSSIFGEVEDTEVQLSDPASPTKAVVGVTASPQQPEVVDVDAGTYSVLNTHNGGIEVEVCPGVTLSDVEPAIPDPFEPATPSG